MRCTLIGRRIFIQVWVKIRKLNYILPLIFKGIIKMKRNKGYRGERNILKFNAELHYSSKRLISFECYFCFNWKLSALSPLPINKTFAREVRAVAKEFILEKQLNGVTEDFRLQDRPSYHFWPEISTIFSSYLSKMKEKKFPSKKKVSIKKLGSSCPLKKAHHLPQEFWSFSSGVIDRQAVRGELGFFFHPRWNKLARPLRVKGERWMGSWLIDCYFSIVLARDQHKGF